ncbi:MAG: MOSC N-terminal beta barrel domain-containing protein [Anaerolineales bacterium]|nr:MOSC N-terminal beta barrel domain-containing protein [Anaerolineales bacterium]
MITVSNLTYYPVKGCRGFDLPAVNLQRAGFERDRRLMFVSPAGEFMTQRKHPRLALITPTLKDEALILSAPNADTIQIPIQTSGKITRVDIWASKGVHAVDQGDDAAAWISNWLGEAARLVHIADGFQRKLDSRYALSADDHTNFADGYPLLILSEESLADLNSRLNAPLPMNRFRPSLVVRGASAFAEDNWKRIRINGTEIALVKPCARCVVTTIDKETLEQRAEPLKTLSLYRKHELGAVFGMNAIPLGEGKIEIGMEVEIL